MYMGYMHLSVYGHLPLKILLFAQVFLFPRADQRESRDQDHSNFLLGEAQTSYIKEGKIVNYVPANAVH